MRISRIELFDYLLDTALGLEFARIDFTKKGRTKFGIKQLKESQQLLNEGMKLFFTKEEIRKFHAKEKRDWERGL